MPLSDDDIREILRLIDESDVDELRVETDAFSLHVLRSDAGAAAPALPAPGETEPPTAAADTPSVKFTLGGASTAPIPPDDLVTISAPMLGTFYRAEAPGAAPFVDVGARVESDTVVCLIEVMKMMNSVPAGVSGTIVEVCAEDAQLVGDGEALFRVEAA